MFVKRASISYSIGLCIVSSVLVCCNDALAEQPYQVEWISQIGTRHRDWSYSVAVDSLDNVYSGGWTTGNMNGPDAPWHSEDAILSKFDTSGNVLWTRQIGTSWDDRIYAVADDPLSNHIYASGTTYSGIGGANVGDRNSFLVKFDTDGNEIWSRHVSTPGIDHSESVAVDLHGNIYISGWTYGDIDGPNAGNSDAFLTKFDPNGNELWSKQVGTTTYDTSLAVSVDTLGNAFMTGWTRGDLEGSNEGEDDAFLTKFDPHGNLLWTRQIGTTGDDHSDAVAVDALGNAYISGWTDGDFGGINAGPRDAFVTKFDADGNVLWSKLIGTSGDDGSQAVAVDALGNIFITGWTWSEIGGPNAGEVDVFLTKLDTDGNALWSQQLGTTYSEESKSVAISMSGDVYISGFTEWSLGGPIAGDHDIFIAKFKIPEPASLALMTLGCLVLTRRT